MNNNQRRRGETLAQKYYDGWLPRYQIRDVFCKGFSAGLDSAQDLLAYANHHPTCERTDEEPCSCGFEAAFDRFNGEK